MKTFKFFRPNQKYEDLGFYEQIEYNQGWVSAQNGEIGCPYDEGMRSHECWIMGFNDYLEYKNILIRLYERL